MQKPLVRAKPFANQSRCAKRKPVASDKWRIIAAAACDETDGRERRSKTGAMMSATRRDARLRKTEMRASICDRHVYCRRVPLQAAGQCAYKR